MKTFVDKPSLSRNLLLTIICYGTFGIFTEIQIMTFSTLAQPLAEMFNRTLYSHYGIVASQGGVSLVTSSMTLGVGIGVAFATVLVLPRLDLRGRKYVTVYIRFTAGMVVGICQLIAGLTNSAELFFLGQIALGLSIPCQFIATTIYLTECAPDSSRGFVSTFLQMGNLFGSLIMYLLAQPAIFGNIQRWPIIPAISVILCILLFICTVFLPESPRWLVSRGRKEDARRSVMFYQGKSADEADEVLTECLMETRLTEEEKLSPRDLVRDESLRAALVIIVSIMAANIVSLSPVENVYVVIIHTQLGLTVAASMQLNFIVHLAAAPLRLMGTLLMDRYGRRFVYYLAAAIAYSKIIIMVVAQLIVYFDSPSTVTVWIVIVNEILSELHGATGVLALTTLLITELFPPAARVAAAQIVFVSMFVSSMPITVLFPILNAFFAPGFYILILCIQPFILTYIFRNLPETTAKSVYEIVHELDEDVRSRSNTKRHSIAVSERTRLLTPRHSIASYHAAHQSLIV